jgi:hypothetical protein
MWFRSLPDTLMLLGGGGVLYDLTTKLFFSKKEVA